MHLGMYWYRRLRAWLAVYRHRVLALLALHLVGWLLVGRGILLPGMPGGDAGGLDQRVRTAVFAMLRPREVLPVTFVDIDDALYRDVWGMPPLTPRAPLAQMLAQLAASGSTLVVADIDLAFGERDPALDEFLRSYHGPAPIVFIRHVLDTPGGPGVLPSPYDATFAANADWLDWAHAYFFSDGDGVLREWLPWLAVCSAGQVSLLPSVAVLAVRHAAGRSLPAPAAPQDCRQVAAAQSYPIVYTEDFGFIGSRARELAWVMDPGSSARVLRAEYLLDGSQIDPVMLRNRIAIVGGSHAAGRDLQATPIGILPGAVVQANTILHASLQLGAGAPAQVQERLLVAGGFLLLGLLNLVVAAVLLAVSAALLAAWGSLYAIFDYVQLMVLLYVQFRFLCWLAKPCWSDLRQHRWRILLPKFLRAEKGG